MCSENPSWWTSDNIFVGKMDESLMCKNYKHDVFIFLFTSFFSELLSTPMKSPRERRVSRGGFANAGIHIQVAAHHHRHHMWTPSSSTMYWSQMQRRGEEGTEKRDQKYPVMAKAFSCKEKMENWFVDVVRSWLTFANVRTFSFSYLM